MIAMIFDCVLCVWPLAGNDSNDSNDVRLCFMCVWPLAGRRGPAAPPSRRRRVRQTGRRPYPCSLPVGTGFFGIIIRIIAAPNDVGFSIRVVGGGLWRLNVNIVRGVISFLVACVDKPQLKK